jgi:hypothetical protein
MRTVRLLVRLLVAAAAALLITVVFDPAAGLASTRPGFSTQPRVVEHPPVGSPILVGLRAGRHASFDRVVFQLDGPIPSYYSVRYVPVVRLDGSGAPLRLRGAAFLEVVVRAPTHDQDYRPVLNPTRLRPDFPALREVTAPASFEGQTTAGVGVTQQVGFRVLELASPARIVIDLAHPSQPTPPVDDGAPSLVVSPSSGPVAPGSPSRARAATTRGRPRPAPTWCSRAARTAPSALSASGRSPTTTRVASGPR